MKGLVVEAQKQGLLAADPPFLAVLANGNAAAENILEVRAEIAGAVGPAAWIAGFSGLELVRLGWPLVADLVALVHALPASTRSCCTGFSAAVAAASHSAKVMPLCAQVACFPVNACHRRTMVST